jgi:hypothetical protein
MRSKPQDPRQFNSDWPTGRMPDAAPNEAKNVEQPNTLMTDRSLPAAWKRRHSGHAVSADLRLAGIDAVGIHTSST